MFTNNILNINLIIKQSNGCIKLKISTCHCVFISGPEQSNKTYILKQWKSNTVAVQLPSHWMYSCKVRLIFPLNVVNSLFQSAAEKSVDILALCPFPSATSAAASL